MLYILLTQDLEIEQAQKYLTVTTCVARLSLNGERGTGNGERGTGNGERGTGNGESGNGNGERGTGNGESGIFKTGNL